MLNLRDGYRAYLVEMRALSTDSNGRDIYVGLTHEESERYHSALRLGLVNVGFARQVFGQWFTARNCARCRFDWRCHFGLVDLQLFKAQLELIDHRVQLLGAATELRTT
jgi:hypothetical protein